MTKFSTLDIILDHHPPKHNMSAPTDQYPSFSLFQLFSLFTSQLTVLLKSSKILLNIDLKAFSCSSRELDLPILCVLVSFLMLQLSFLVRLQQIVQCVRMAIHQHLGCGISNGGTRVGSIHRNNVSWYLMDHLELLFNYVLHVSFTTWTKHLASRQMWDDLGNLWNI